MFWVVHGELRVRSRLRECARESGSTGPKGEMRVRSYQWCDQRIDSLCSMKLLQKIVSYKICNNMYLENLDRKSSFSLDTIANIIHI